MLPAQLVQVAQAYNNNNNILEDALRQLRASLGWTNLPY
jgi:hypothetical protein